jgi:hypothetical protein
MIYDATDRKGLTQAWFLGGALYEALRRLDTCAGFARWEDALSWINTQAEQTGRKIGQIQYWGHGNRGLVAMNGAGLNAHACSHPYWGGFFRDIKRHLTPDSLLWFRTCATFGGAAGQRFARNWSNALGCRVAGHTHIIGPLQSGLHSLAPGDDFSWSQQEGLDGRDGVAASSPWAPNTITCLHGSVPAGW